MAVAASLEPQGLFGGSLGAKGWHNTVMGGFIGGFYHDQSHLVENP